ncbi:DUF389 domain-containing protein [Microvirga makkahensis]|uniref:DUF389 domain-containing protein n=1 Tax=Microvirga makkahensis TaxID=1128670 RepID=A0A7X3MRD9_9HYPH|nr:DUF389 domain-containing protein [Microvirga makkahensis]MXQ11746.1 DUF389 domain-containing protein [Microvirga makkahensis]
MRQMIVRVPRGQGGQVVSLARMHKGRNLSYFEAEAEEGPCDVVLVHVPNTQVEALLDELDGIPDLHLTLIPRGVITLRPPASQAPEQVVDVAHRSPIEIYLGGLQSVGSWTGFLGYAVAAGIVVWIGLFTNTVYLLTAAMLIAPFAGPAMNSALATARGDVALLGRSVLRYFVALAVAILVAWGLSWAMSQRIASEQMISTSMISSVTVLLPLVAGAAGALNLSQSDRSSLVSGAATGMLVAASLAPPAGTIGMASAIGEWDLVKSGAFILLLQLVGINLSGTIVFRLFGLSPKGVRYVRGRAWLGITAWSASLAAVVALLTWQFSSSPNLQRSTQAQHAAAVVQEAINASGLAKPVRVSADFTRADIPGQNTLLVEAYVQASRADEKQRIEQDLSSAIQSRLKSQFNVTPLVDLTVLTPSEP